MAKALRVRVSPSALSIGLTQLVFFAGPQAPQKRLKPLKVWFKCVSPVLDKNFIVETTYEETAVTANLPTETTKPLYEKDYFLWLRSQIEALRSRRLEAVDIDNLVEELEDLGRSEKKAVSSDLRVLLIHLLKWKYQSQKRTNSWQATIAEHRQRLEESFEVSPSLRRYYQECFAQSCQAACRGSSAQTGIPVDKFPGECPFESEQVLDLSWLPN